MTRGVVYLAVDEPKYLRLFEISLHSLRSLGGYDGPVQLLTNLDPPLRLEEVRVTRLGEVAAAPGLERSRHIKTRLLAVARDINPTIASLGPDDTGRAESASSPPGGRAAGSSSTATGWTRCTGREQPWRRSAAMPIDAMFRSARLRPPRY